MSLAKEILKKRATLEKLLPSRKSINKEAWATLNELGNLELQCQNDTIVLSPKAVRELYSVLSKWYGQELYLE